MSRLKELIERLCPDGVEFSPLKNIAIIKNGKDYKHCGPGDIPVYGSGGIMTYIDQFCYDKPTVLLPRKGSIGKIYYVETPFWNVDTVYYTDINTTKVCPKFLYYFLATIDLEKMNCGKGAVPSLTQEILYRIIIPVPPIEVQEEIVRILDRFADYAASLQAELQAELQARKEQYEYYRNLLLTFNPSACGCGTDGEQEIKVTTWGGNYKVIWKAMGEICDLSRGKVYSKDYLRNNSGSYPVYSSQTVNNGELGRISTYDIEGEYLSWTTDGAYAGSIFYRSGKFSITNVCGLIKPSKIIDIHFLHHWLTLQAPKHVYQGMGNPKLMSNQMSEIRVPILPIEHQKKIASILDRFEALVNDLTQGLPAEMAAVRERYEYYRNKLLTFKRIA